MLPTNPTINQTYSVGNRLYTYDGYRWNASMGRVVNVFPSPTPSLPPAIPDDDLATEREQLLSFGSRLYTLAENRWVISIPSSSDPLQGIVIQGPTGPQGEVGPQGPIGSGPQSQLDDLINKINALEDKIVSIDERLDDIPTETGGFLKLEQNTSIGPQYIPVPTLDFFDNVADGDINEFVVTYNQRGNYSLNGVPQPSVEVPVPDVMVFDLSQLPEDDYENFDIFKNGVVLDHGILREYDEKRITVYTNQLSEDITKLFYKHRTKKGLGFVISIIRY